MSYCGIIKVGEDGRVQIVSQGKSNDYQHMFQRVLKQDSNYTNCKWVTLRTHSFFICSIAFDGDLQNESYKMASMQMPASFEIHDSIIRFLD